MIKKIFALTLAMALNLNLFATLPPDFPKEIIASKIEEGLSDYRIFLEMETIRRDVSGGAYKGVSDSRTSFEMEMANLSDKEDFREELSLREREVKEEFKRAEKLYKQEKELFERVNKRLTIRAPIRNSDPFVDMVIDYYLAHENAQMLLLESGAVAKLAAQENYIISRDLARIILKSPPPRNITDILGSDFRSDPIEYSRYFTGKDYKDLGHLTHPEYYIRSSDDRIFEEKVRVLQINEPFYVKGAGNKISQYQAGDIFLITTGVGVNESRGMPLKQFKRKFGFSELGSLKKQHIIDYYGRRVYDFVSLKKPKIDYAQKVYDLSIFTDGVLRRAIKNANLQLKNISDREIFLIFKTFFDKVTLNNSNDYNDLVRGLKGRPINGHVANIAKQVIKRDYDRLSPFFRGFLKHFTGAAVLGMFIVIEELLNVAEVSAQTKEAKEELRELLADKRAAKVALIEEARQKPELAALFNEEDIRDILNRKEPPVKPEDIYWAKYNLLATIYGIQEEGTLDNELYKRNLREWEEAKQEEYKERLKGVIKRDATYFKSPIMIKEL
jgi:hypothetical protein